MTNKLIFSLILLLFFVGCGENSENGNVIEESNSYGTITIVDTIKIEYKVEASETAKLENDIINFEFSPKPGDLKYIVNDQEITEKKYSIPINDLGDKLSIFVIPTGTTTQGDKDLKININSKTIDDLIVDGKITSQFTTTAGFEYNIPWPIWLTILVWVGLITALISILIVITRILKLKLLKGSSINIKQLNNPQEYSNTIYFKSDCTKLIFGNATITNPNFIQSLLGEKYQKEECSQEFGFIIEPQKIGNLKYHSISSPKDCTIDSDTMELNYNSKIIDATNLTKYELIYEGKTKY